VVSVLAVAGVLVWALRQPAPTLPTSAGALLTLAGAVALYFVACAVRGERWLVLLHHNGARPRRADAYGLVAVGYLGNTLLPARAGDAARVLLLAPRAQTGNRTVVGTLLAERLLDVAVLAALFCVVTFGVLSGVAVPDGGRLVLAGAVLAAALVMAACAAAIAHRRGALRRVAAFVEPMVAAVRNLRGRHLAAVLALSAVVWGIEIAVWWATAQAVALEISFVQAAYLLALASFFVLIPSGPGYAGTLDAALVFGVRALGLGGAAALSYLVTLRFVLFVPITLAGLVVVVARYGGLQRLRGLRAVRA
jgi:uncharacterized protein (TIRG00374 family)